ncbi:MAG: methyltransferase domain-containing protein [Sedimentisphaerales bacterium]|nr:methyltransferase domain-containing protein [Sedimentisphaerales bacterium]
MRAWHFIRQFFRHPRQIGTVTQSSRSLAVKIAEEIGPSKEVVEFGAGTGPVTQEILRRLPADGRLTCFEINPEFCRHLQQIGDARLRVINDDAKNCQQYVERADCVVSGLPLALFGRREKQRILDITSKSPTFVQLQYTPVLGRTIKRHFPSVKRKFVARNLPPAFVYVGRHVEQTTTS